MSIKEMDPIQHVVSCKSDQNKVLKSNGCEPKIYIDSSHNVRLCEVLQSLRKEKLLCDIKLQTDDGEIVYGHKVVLVSASPYFRAMFTSFTESDKDLVNIKELDSNILQLLVDYIYTGEIMVTEQNVLVLLPAAILLQLDYVKSTCVEFLQNQLNPSNCLDIKEFAEFYNCMELLSSSEEYIKKNFLKVVETDEFLALSSEEVIKLISRDDINVPFEEKIFECVINWVKQKLDRRYGSLPLLMEHVRLSLAPQEYISIKVVGEPLLTNNTECKDFVIEALSFHILKRHQYNMIPQTIRNSPRQYKQKFVLGICADSSEMNKCYTIWYDPLNKLLYKTTEMIMRYGLCTVALVKEHLVFALGNNYNNSGSIEMLDLSSQTLQWVSTVEMLVDRNHFGVGVLDDRIYAFGGFSGASYLNSAEVFDVSIQEWRLVSSMSTKRMNLGVGILNNHIYVVGGYKYPFYLRSVECYDPSLDSWTTVTEMSTSRRYPGIGVLDGVMYAVGGECKDNTSSVVHKSVEAYSPISKVWSPIADMHLRRSNPSVVAFNGLLYVMGGFDGSTHVDSVEIYDPDTKIWTIEPFSTSVGVIYGAVVVDKPPHLRTD